MIYGLYQSAAGMMTSEYRQDVLANNIANAETPGFKRDIAVFTERTPAWESGTRNGPSDTGLANMTGGMWLGRTTTDFGEATKIRTDNALDLALDGPGFFVVDDDGEPQLTRDGRMITDEHGQLRAVSDGAPVLSVGGGPIFVDPHASQDQIRVDENGRVYQDQNLVGQLALVDVEDYSTLQKTDGQRFVGPDSEGIPATGLVRSGYVEAAGIQPVQELVSLMDASRAYQMNAQMVRLQDESVSRLISTTLRA